MFGLSTILISCYLLTPKIRFLILLFAAINFLVNWNQDEPSPVYKSVVMYSHTCKRDTVLAK